MADIQRIAFCPHCGHKTTHRIVFTHSYETTIYMPEVDNDDCQVSSTYHVSICNVCEQIVLLRHWNHCDDRHDCRAVPVVVWPAIRALPPVVPARIREIYDEARAVREHAPNAFATQIRRAIEALCDDRGAKPGSLAKRLSELAAKGELPAVLADVAEILRLLGNRGAHAAEMSVTLGQVHVIDDFFNAVIEYVYVARSRVNKFRDDIEALRRSKEPRW